jgi:predicted transcriptional regulator
LKHTPIKKIENMQLSNSEEQLMQHLWKLEKAFMKDLLEAFPIPKPAATTVATHENITRWSKKPIISQNTSTD